MVPKIISEQLWNFSHYKHRDICTALELCVPIVIGNNYIDTRINRSRFYRFQAVIIYGLFPCWQVEILFFFRGSVRREYGFVNKLSLYCLSFLLFIVSGTRSAKFEWTD